MDNITKALLIAGGVFITIMVVSLLVIFRNQMAGYFTEEHDAKIVEQTKEFNNRFENYNGQTIRGNELISIMNRVSDYNNTAADIEKYDKVIIEIDLDDKEDQFRNDTDSDVSIFKGLLNDHKLANNQSSDSELNKIVNFTLQLMNKYPELELTDVKLQKLSSEISNIVDPSQEEDDDYKKKRIKKLKQILGDTIAKRVEDGDTMLLKEIQDATKQYYQYTQFKRAMFDCTGVEYNVQNGRVNKITFEIKVDSDNKVIFD